MMSSTDRSVSGQLLTMARGGDAQSKGRLFELYRPYLRLLAQLQIDEQFQAKIDAVWSIFSPGKYTVRFLMRKHGTAIDAFVLQLTDLSAPTGEGPGESSSTPENMFVESQGQVVVEAEHFFFRTPSDEGHWLVVPDEAPGAEAHRNFRGTGYIQVLRDGGDR